MRKPVSEGVDLEARELLAAVGAGDREALALPEVWDDRLYVVPPAPPGEPKFFTMRIDPRQLDEETRNAGATLWGRFVTTFQSSAREHRRPLRSLSRWHLALALSAGQISGAVRSNDGRTLLVRGDTHKEKNVKVEHEINERTGDVRETRIHLDRFVPVIRAIDFTPGSATFGAVLTIR